MPRLTLTRIGHATTLIDFDGDPILTDPWFSTTPIYNPGERRALDVGDLPEVAGVVISHEHYDHNDVQSLAQYWDHGIPIAAEAGAVPWAQRVGFFGATPLAPWESIGLNGVTVTATPGAHAVPEVTFILQHKGFTVYFGGDSLRIPELDEIAARFPRIDLALLPINGLCIRPLNDKQVVMNPLEAADLVRVLKPRIAVPIHYTFDAGPLFNRTILKYYDKQEALPHLFRDAVARVAPRTKVKILPPGESLTMRSA